jgi:hypothetical protein
MEYQMKLPKDMQKTLLALLITTIGSSIGFLVVEAWRPISIPFWTHIAPAIPTSTLLSLCTLLLLLTIVLSAWVAYLHFPNNTAKFRKRFKFDPSSGASIAENGEYVCTRCLFHDPPIEAPLFHHSGSYYGAQCPNCGTSHSTLESPHPFNVK